MSEVYATPFYLLQGADLIVKVKASNAIGWSPYSTINIAPDIAFLEVPPLKPLASPARDYLLSTDLLLQVTWAALESPEHGGA